MALPPLSGHLRNVLTARSQSPTNSGNEVYISGVTIHSFIYLFIYFIIHLYKSRRRQRRPVVLRVVRVRKRQNRRFDKIPRVAYDRRLLGHRNGTVRNLVQDLVESGLQTRKQFHRSNRADKRSFRLSPRRTVSVDDAMNIGM
jgi:hypothetical protein